jgi:hypothetical protein
MYINDYEIKTPDIQEICRRLDWDKIEPATPCMLQIGAHNDGQSWLLCTYKENVLECKTVSYGTQRFGVGIHVHHVIQRKRVKLLKASHLRPSSPLICISMLLQNTPLPLNPIIPQHILGFWSATSWVHSCKQTRSQTWPFVSPA